MPALTSAFRHKTSETLLGIETRTTIYRWSMRWRCHKTSETLLGIETCKRNFTRCLFGGHKTSETLLGIETDRSSNFAAIASRATKPLKPF